MKHLHADLPNLFSPKLPKLSSIQLPSGSPYVRPMAISAIRTLTCYSYEIGWYSNIVEIKLTKLTTAKALLLSYPQFPQNSVLKRYLAFTQQWLPYPSSHPKRYFRTNDDALIDAFINYPHTQKTNPEFIRIKTAYPEYFI